jgi:pilus assembly protein FimV
MVAADSKAKLLQEAERYVLHGKIQQAISEYLKIIQLDSDDVLILNTIGDLYLRKNNSIEANKYFSKVAENYVRNNFFLKAIAVYKKILKADPNNLEVNLTTASLYAKQGLSIDARSQYLQVAALLEKEGRTKESMEVYEKIVELDPSNTATQRKLAELYLSEGAEEKARIHWTGAARSQLRAGDMAGAVDSFTHAVQHAPLAADIMKDFLECCIKMGDVRPALDQLIGSVEAAPDNPDLRELLGQAYLANSDPEAAAKAFQVVVSMDESRYQNFFPLAQALIDRGEYDQALSSLDTIIPTLITRRETERAAKLYELILQRCPKHIPALVRLASIYSATGNQARYLVLLDEIADYYLSNKSPIEALEYLEKIIQANPESNKHRKLHHQAFIEAYPNAPYVPPPVPQGPLPEVGTPPEERDTTALDGEIPSALVEADLLLNYGMREKALSLLLNEEARDPFDMEVRVRLLALYKAEKKSREAAEQCLLMAALQRRAKNEESAQNYLAEAKQLAPEMAAYETDLEAFARRNGIVEESSISTPPSPKELKPDAEVDLSADLLDIFFAGGQGSVNGEDSEPQPIQEMIPDTYPQGISTQSPSKSVQEQLQEVDFYIRLGFHDEALAKLNEIAKVSPDNPELAVRYRKIEEIGHSCLRACGDNSL